MASGNHRVSVIDKWRSHKLQIDFHIKVHKVHLNTPLKTCTKVSWKRSNHYSGQKLAETSAVYSSTPDFTFNEILTMVNSIYYKSSGPLSKTAELKVLTKTTFAWKELGRIVLNLSDYLNSALTETDFPLENSENSSITLSISTKISALSQAKVFDPSIPVLEKQLIESQVKLDNVKKALEAETSEKNAIWEKVQKLNEELGRIQNSEMRNSKVVVKGENVCLKRILVDLEREIEEGEEKVKGLEEYLERIGSEWQEGKADEKASVELERIIKEYW